MPQLETFDRLTPEDISLKNDHNGEKAFIKESDHNEINTAKQAFEALWDRFSNKEKENDGVRETIKSGISLIKESFILQVLEERGVANVPRVLRNEQGIPGSISGFAEDNKLVRLITGKNQAYLFASLAIEKIEGTTWSEHSFLTENRTLDEQSLIKASLEAARVFDAIYKAGFMHNDIKPDNLMIGDDGKVTVIDFNVAERHDNGVCWSIMGTPMYVAPERENPEIIDGYYRSQYKVTGDIYSLALTIAEKAGVNVGILREEQNAPERRRHIFIQSIEDKIARNEISQKLAVFLMWNTGEARYRNSDFEECMGVLRLMSENDTSADEVQSFFLNKYEQRQKDTSEN